MSSTPPTAITPIVNLKVADERAEAFVLRGLFGFEIDREKIEVYIRRQFRIGLDSRGRYWAFRERSRREDEGGPFIAA